MPIPDVSVSVSDGAIGLGASDGGQGTQLKIGVSSKGTVRTLYSYAGATAIAKMHDDLGEGPLVEAAALALAAGGAVLAMPATQTTAGSVGAVTHSGTGTAIFAVAGAAYDSYDVKVKIITAAANLAAAAAQMQLSLDGGKTWGPVVAVPTSGTYAIPSTNITITITDGTFVVDDTYTFAGTAPAYNTTELTACFAAALLDPREWFLVHAVHPQSSVANSATMAASLDTNLTTAANAYRFARGLVESAKDTDANIIAGFVAFSSRRTLVAGRFGNVASPLNGRQMLRSVAWTASARAGSTPPSEDMGRVATGSVAGVVAIDSDERVTPGLDATGFLTYRTIIGEPGFYITSGRVKAPPGSDFSYLQYGRVMDIACSNARQGMLKYLNASLRVNANGTINEKDAQAIERELTRRLETALIQPSDADGPGYASAVRVAIDRSINLQSTGNLAITVTVRPKGYARNITITLGFSNPAQAAPSQPAA